MSTLALSTSSLENTLTLFSIMFACHGASFPLRPTYAFWSIASGNISAALLAFAFLIHLSLSSIVILAPLLLLLITNPLSHLASPRPISASLWKTIPLLGEITAYTLILSLASTLVAGSWAWIPQTWGATYVTHPSPMKWSSTILSSRLTLPDLTPNPGMWWYFFTEMFDHFRPFFLMVFSVRQPNLLQCNQLTMSLVIDPPAHIYSSCLHQIPVSILIPVPSKFWCWSIDMTRFTPRSSSSAS